MGSEVTSDPEASPPQPTKAYVYLWYDHLSLSADYGNVELLIPDHVITDIFLLSYIEYFTFKVPATSSFSQNERFPYSVNPPPPEKCANRLNPGSGSPNSGLAYVM